MIGLLGKKLGVTQVFTEDRRLTAVSVVEAGPCPILEIKVRTIQIGFETVKESRIKKPQLGKFKKLNLKPNKIIKEVPKDTSKEFKLGEELKVDLFKAGDFVDVTSISKGKGFQGGMKRWGWKGGPKGHGSMSHRRIGSVGASTNPGRVWKGQNLPGHMGDVKVTLENLKVLKVDPANNLLVIKGALPGHKNSYLLIKTAKKKNQKLNK